MHEFTDSLDIRRFCADEGLISPGVSCVAGYVCQSRGLRVPEMPCPPGHFCLDGTSTSDATSKKTKNKPYPCPRGYYCTHGVKTPISEASNFSTPQPCIPGYFCKSGSETPHGQGPCPSGFHCPTYAPGVAKVCGPGSFCPGVANTVPLHCTPGTSNRLVPIPTYSNVCIERESLLTILVTRCRGSQRAPVL